MNPSEEYGTPVSRAGVDGCTVLLVLWGLFIVYGTLLPFNFTLDATQAATRLRALDEPLRHRVSLADVVSNVLLFLPWGFLVGCRPSSWHGRLGKTLAVAALSGLVLSGAVECAQLFLPSRTTSLVDLTTNTTGAALGALVGWLLTRRVWPAGLPKLTRFVAARPMATCALAAAIGLVFAGLSPFDVSIDLGELKAALKQARVIPFGPSPAPDPWAWVQEWLTWVLMGGLAVIALRETGRGGLRGFARAVVLCGGLAAFIEVAQLLIVSRRADMTSVVLALTGALAGAGTVTFSPRRSPSAWVAPALGVWTLTVLLASWTPTHVTPPSTWTVSWSQFVPFWSYYRKTDLGALSDLFNQLLGFVPLGAAVAIGRTRRPVALALALGLGLGFVVECGQLMLADRTAEITDVLSAGAGAALGARLWAWGVSLRASATGHARYRVR